MPCLAILGGGCIKSRSSQAEAVASTHPTVADNPLPNTINYLFNHEKHESRENLMVPVADVTEMVRPQLEKAWNDGIEKGIAQTAKRMKAAGANMELISESTGLSNQEIEKL